MTLAPMTRLLTLAALALCLAFLLLPRFHPLVQAGESHLGHVAVAASTTYVSLRAINAALSVAQEVEVGASVGISGSVPPLGWLDPLDDTVERVSALVFAVAGLAGLLSLALGPIASIGFVVGAIGLVGLWACTERTGAEPVRRASARCALIGLTLAVLLPGAVAAGAFLGEALTATRASEAKATLDAISDRAQNLITLDGWAGWRESYDAFAGSAWFFWDQADDLLKASLTLAGIFALRLLVLPFVLLWVVLRVTRRL